MRGTELDLLLQRVRVQTLWARTASTHPLSVYQAGLSNLFGLLAASVLRDKGNPSSFPSIDRAGKKRPAGGAPDIGAYEFG